MRRCQARVYFNLPKAAVFGRAQKVGSCHSHSLIFFCPEEKWVSWLLFWASAYLRGRLWVDAFHQRIFGSQFSLNRC